MAGETLKNALLQARLMSDPVASRTQGWWLEFYLFYVRVGDLESADVLRNMIIDPTQNVSSINITQVIAAHYHTSVNTPSWSYECMKVVARAYFRKEGEAWNDFQAAGYCPFVQMAGTTVLDSLHTDAELGAPTDSDLWLRNWNAYQAARAAKLTTNTFGEYLAKQGVAVPPQLTEPTQDYRIPELVRFVRDFAYPVPTVDPTSGQVRSTVQWSLAERVDKRRYFAEPGFLYGCAVVRPKVYFANQVQAAADSLLSTNNGWMPPELDTDPHTAMQKYAGGATDNGGFLKPDATLPAHWVDIRDLYLYGDQFVNGPIEAGAYASLPALNLSNKKYPTATDSAACFVTTDGTQRIWGDGICTFRIASRLGAADTTV